ncbi:MAG: hypothetical protein HQ518_19785 [Rhodopirellula sp.]|nr:hypothetical protein [Rhodopirellula sp.]
MSCTVGSFAIDDQASDEKQLRHKLPVPGGWRSSPGEPTDQIYWGLASSTTSHPSEAIVAPLAQERHRYKRKNASVGWMVDQCVFEIKSGVCGKRRPCSRGGG